jgi:hypothetical protein
MEPIEVGFQAYVADGGEEFGAVRAVAPNEWSGHRPESMLRRYHIVDLDDLRRAGERLPGPQAEHHQGRFWVNRPGRRKFKARGDAVVELSEC